MATEQGLEVFGYSDCSISRPREEQHRNGMYDKLKARELMAIAGGELKQRHEHKHTFDHAAYLGAEPPAGDEE